MKRSHPAMQTVWVDGSRQVDFLCMGIMPGWLSTASLCGKPVAHSMTPQSHLDAKYRSDL